MAVHQSTGPWTVPNAALYSYAVTSWVSPPINVAGETPDVGCDLRVWVHMTGADDWDSLSSLWLRTPSLQYVKLAELRNMGGWSWTDLDGIDHEDTNELGRTGSPFKFRDDRPHNTDRDRFYSLYDPTLDGGAGGYVDFGYTAEIDGTFDMRSDEELWSIGKRGPINGDYNLAIFDFGSEAITGVPVVFESWAVEIFVPPAGSVTVGPYLSGVSQ